MKITLYLVEGIFDFRLPNQVSGSFSFDPDEVDDKLINIEARDGKWVLYSTSDVKVVNNGTVVKESELIHNSFYTLRRENKNYLIYVCSLLESKMTIYNSTENTRLIIGNNNSCNVKYNCPFSNSLVVALSYSHNGVFIQREGNIVFYVNKKPVNETQFSINYGDEIEIYGLRIIILKNYVFINNLSNLQIIEQNASLTKFNLNNEMPPEDIEVKDLDLYSKEDYASKAPRIRRLIEDKKIKLINPPANPKKDELPTILVIGPMLTMGIVSVTMVINTFSNIFAGTTSFGKSWPQILTALAMLLSALLWPSLTRKYQKKLQIKKEQELKDKYNAYLDKKNKELDYEAKLEKTILQENLITLDQCLENIKKRNINFWSKRIDQNDFLVARIGVGREALKAEVQCSEDEIDIEENELKKSAEAIVEKYKYIDNVPVGYSFFENTITAIMGNRNKTVPFVNNILLQFISFYSYEDLKIVVLTNENYESNWDYLKYLNHTFSNDKSFRFFGCDYDSRKNVAEYLSIEASNRVALGLPMNKPHYIILTDDYDKIKRYDFVETITESENNLGFSFIIVENLLSKLPSKCDNFITLNEAESGVLKNSYEKQEQVVFKDEINYNIDMMEIAKIVSNIPIEFEEGMKELPNSITFLEMEQVGKIEQLNILNRWNTNDSASSLRSEIGVDEQGDLMYLDLHEKYHGPHGLIAGTTGSGKSEFIITYILSMSINYSPDDVAFILIDYKGGGLAFAFENKTNNIVLPHLAGTITNLDKAEMDRTLVSIDSEVKRRQHMFNDARDRLGESTIDIYKYQKYYKEGKLEEPIPHLFIICDEFAELKSQQPEFMDNLISVARIGRSLGVHLILATQKPSGVVNDQIWSNSKFKVCLKVQDEADSKEMIKRADAAYIKQAGRFFLQVGYDEFFALGQSGWCGAKYYPSDKIVKQVDKSVNFIDSCGAFIKSIQASGGIKIKPEGEQLANIMHEIISVSNTVGKKARKLWLDNIPEVIINDEVVAKYKYTSEPYNVSALIGEYDAPEKQEQGKVVYNFLEDGNTLIYGNDGSEREMLLDSIIYSSTKNHKTDELNFYVIDYGSESFRKYSKLPHMGGIVYLGEDEKYNNLLKLIKKDIQKRKKLFADFGGEYKNYIKNSGKKLPLKVVIINNYDSVYENNATIYDELPDLTRDSERYGIVFIITGNAVNSIQSRIVQNFHNNYVFKLKEISDYTTIFGQRCKTAPRDMLGRGIIKNDGLHEFQVTTLHSDADTLNEFMNSYIEEQIKLNTTPSEKIPVLPNFVRFENIMGAIDGLKAVPIGLNKTGLEPVTLDCLSNLGIIVAANRVENTTVFMNSLTTLFGKYKNLYLSVIDAAQIINVDNLENYYNKDFENVIDNITTYIQNLYDTNSTAYGIIILTGVSKLISKLSSPSKLANLTQLINKYEKISVILCDDAAKLKKSAFEAWFTAIFNLNYGLWVGRGASDQNLLHIGNVTREMTKDYKNNMGYFINEGFPTLIKLIDLVSDENAEDEDEE